MVVFKKILLMLMVLTLVSCAARPVSTSSQQPQQDMTLSDTATADTTTPAEPATSDDHSAAAPQYQLSQFDTVWQRIGHQVKIKVPDNADIRAQRAFYKRHQKLLDEVSRRAEPFLYHIVLELEKRKMPVELALLPIVESSFNPLAQAGAPAGLWQMVPQTARNFGLKRNEWYDGRKDPIASTAATLDYLQYLYQLLGQDWLNAVAGYNSGEGTIERAIRRNQQAGKPIDFWSLNLPRKSTIYMPKWLALIDLVQKPEQYDVRWGYIANKPSIGFASIKGPVDMAQAASLAGLSLIELKKLNPAFRKSTTAPGGPYTLVLPLDKVDSFNRQSEQLKLQKISVTTDSYTVKSGDSLGSIAKRYQITVAALRKANQLSSDQLKIGQKLALPGAAFSSGSFAASGNQHNEKASSKKPSQQRSYQVKTGDNLWDLSREFKVDLMELARLNKLTKSSALKPGQKILIPTTAKISQAKNSKSKDKNENTARYTVKSGDSLDKIARKHKVKVADLMRWNALQAHSTLQPGQKLKVSGV